MKLSDTQFQATRDALLGPKANDLIRYMAGQSVSLDDQSSPNEAEETAQSLEWLIPQSNTRTTLGYLVSDSCREFLFWKERNKELPFENTLSHLSDALFQGKYVAEIGSGMGANLMSLAHRTGRLCGVEPVEAYVQLGQIFCEKEGLAAIDTQIGGAENLPFEKNELDLILCISAHQYFNIDPAFREVARVLKPGGEFVVIGGTFSSYARHSLDYLLNSEGPKAVLITLVNSLSYTLAGRRLIGTRNGFSTSRPVYPTVKAMTRWFKSAGFELASPIERVGEETCFHVKLAEQKKTIKC